MEPGRIERRNKMLVGALMVAILALSLIALQQQFDQGDHRHALELLMSKPRGASWSVAEELNLRAGTHSPVCSPRVVSAFAGTIDVACTAGDPPTYHFAVDLVRKTVQPSDAPTRALMEAVAAKNHGSGPGDGGTSPNG